MELKLLVHHRRITSCKLILSGWMTVYSNYDLGPNFLLLNWPLMRKENSSERQHPIKRRESSCQNNPSLFHNKDYQKSISADLVVSREFLLLIQSPSHPKVFISKTTLFQRTREGPTNTWAAKIEKKLLKECRCFFLFYLERNGGGVGSAINHFLAVVKNYLAWYW